MNMGKFCAIFFIKGNVYQLGIRDIFQQLVHHGFLLPYFSNNWQNFMLYVRKE